MISSAGDYQYVSIDGVLIDGGIMPLRNGDGINSQDCLRGEDPAHLIEASSRLRAVLDHETSMGGEGGDGDLQVVDNHILRSRFVGVLEQLKVIQPHVIKATEGDLPIKWDCSNIKSSVVDIYGGYTMKTSEGEWGVGGEDDGGGGDQPIFSTGIPLRKQPILNLFEDVHNMKTLNGNMPIDAGQLSGYDDWHIWVDTSYYKDGFGDTPGWLASPTGPNIVASGILLFASSGTILAETIQEDGVIIGWQNPKKWVEKEYCYPSSGKFEFAMGGWGKWTQFVKKVWFGFRVRVGKYQESWPHYDTGNYVTTTYHKIYYPIEADWNAGSGEASVDVSKINDMTRDCLEHYGFSTGYTDDNMNPSTTYAAYLEYDNMVGGTPYGVEQVDVILQVNDDCW